MFTIVGSFFAGLGLFFTGVSLISSNIKQATSRRFRLLVSKWIHSKLLAGWWGAISGAATQSSSAVTFIVVSLITSGLMKIKEALPIIVWANVGVCALVMIAVLDIKLFVLYLLGITGLSFAFEKPARFKNLIGALFGVGLLFFGLQLMRSGAGPLAEFEWFQNMLLYTKESYGIAFAIGAFLTVLAQSSAAVSVIAITMTKAGVFDVSQTIMIIYGTNVGASINTWFLSYGLKGTSKQLAMFQVLFNIFGGLLFVPLFYLEIYSDIPLIKSLVSVMSGEVEQQMAYVFLFFNLLIAIVLMFFLGPIQRILEKNWPPTEEEDKSKAKYIHEQALADPETALDLVEKEHLRLIRRLPEYIEILRIFMDEEGVCQFDSIHNPFTNLSKDVHSFLNDVHERNLDPMTSERFLKILNRHNTLETIEENVLEFALTISKPGYSEGLKKLIGNIIEAVDTIVLTAIDAFESFDDIDIDMLLNLTADKSSLMSKIRKTYLSGAQTLGPEDKSLVLDATNYFERIVWLLGNLGKTLVTEEV